ncbi:hypothetical protein BWI17_20520 [Betaproteobacteria bacterium GR16-43]|nr:hypothetical protein BWI17_20520 [Betaproteobacteria bacterium GR16-43]
MVTRQWQSKDGTWLCVRPLVPADFGIAREALSRLSPGSRYLRFFVRGWRVNDTRLAQVVDPDPEVIHALIVTAQREGKEQAVAAGRFFIGPRGDEAEFALLVADEWQRKGIGKMLLGELVEEARRRGLKRLFGEILANNAGMLAVAAALGFAITTHPEDRKLRLAVLAP